MRMRKMSWTDGSLSLSWTTDHDGGLQINHEIESKDRPSDEFVEALDGFAPLLRKLLGLREHYKLDVRSVSVRYNDEQRRSVIVSAVHPLESSNSPFNVNTPLLREIGEEGSGYQIIEDIFEAVDELASGATDYVKSIRDQQTDLFVVDGEDAPEPATDEYEDSVDEAEATVTALA